MKLLKVKSKKVQGLLNNPRFVSRLRRKIALDSNYHVPYLSGYSKDGRTVFFDKDLKPWLKYQGKMFDVRDFLIVHEVAEKALMDLFKLRYQVAHHIATHIENGAVNAAGLSWRVYSTFLRPQIKHVYHRDIWAGQLPPQLDPRPYKDEEERQILASLLKNSTSSGPIRRQNRSAIYRRH